MPVDPRTFRANAGPSRAQLFQLRRMSIDSLGSNNMSNLNNFQSIYNTDESNYPRPYHRRLHVDLNAPADTFVHQSMD